MNDGPEWLMHPVKLMIFAIACSALAQGANAQGDDGGDSLELTMRLLPAGATSPDAITKTIVLPPAAADRAVERNADGLERANEARGGADNENRGQDVSAEARGLEDRGGAGAGRSDAGGADGPGRGDVTPPETRGPPEAAPGRELTPPGAQIAPEAAVPPGRAVSAEAREAAAQRGQETSAEARERGREFGQDVADQARENRNDVGRGNAPAPPERPEPRRGPPQ